MLNPKLKHTFCLALSAAVILGQGMGYEHPFAGSDMQKTVVSAAKTQ